jgi:hypothetical protein
MTRYWLIPYWNKNSVGWQLLHKHMSTKCRWNNKQRARTLQSVRMKFSHIQPTTRSAWQSMSNEVCAKMESWWASLSSLYPEGANSWCWKVISTLNLWTTLWSVGYATAMVIRDRKKIKTVPVSGQDVTKSYGGNGNSASRIPNLDTRRKLLTRLTYLIDVLKHLFMSALY